MTVQVAEANTGRDYTTGSTFARGGSGSFPRLLGKIRLQQPALHKGTSLGLALWKYVFVYMTIWLR